MDRLAAVSSSLLRWNSVLYLAGFWLLYHFVYVLYNVSPFHPLSRFPGPKLAAASFLYEAWYDLIQGGRYTSKIKKMHEIYGPVVRINPEELHFNDVGFVDEIFAGMGRRRDKHVHFLNCVTETLAPSMFATEKHELHRIRRNAMNKFFSRVQISKLESIVKDLADGLCDKILRLNVGVPVDAAEAYSCFTSDVISGYCFGEPFGFVQQEHWKPNFRKATIGAVSTTYVFRFFPFLRHGMKIAPLFTRWMDDSMLIMTKMMNEQIPARVRAARKQHEAGIIQDRPSVFSTIMGSDLPEAEKSDARLIGEGFTTISAGTETTAWTLAIITFYLLNQPETLARLTKELKDADAENLSWFALEQLPYLNAVISEGLRLGYGVSMRISRIAPDENLVYKGEFKGQALQYLIPAGTPMAMSNTINHHNEDVFPDSHAFKPERWIEASQAEKYRMDTNMTSFSKGSRQCIGINLAYCDMFVGVATLTLRVFPRMKLYETTVEDVRYDHDMFIPQAKPGSKGVRVVLS